MNEDCRTLQEALLDWIDGRGSAADAARVEAHVAGCARCRALGAPLKADGPLVLGRLEVPARALAEMRADLDERLDEIEDARRGWFASLFSGSFAIPKPLAWGAAAALVLLLSGREARPARPARPAPPPAAILMDGVDRLGDRELEAQG